MKPHYSRKLTNAQLARVTYMNNAEGTPMTIGDLTIDQLRVHLFDEFQERTLISKNIAKAFMALSDIQP